MQNQFILKLFHYALLLSSLLVGPSLLAQGRLETIRVEGASLVGNLEGDDPVRDVLVYLPPSYSSESNKRYPVIYFLHGYGLGAKGYADVMGLPATMDTAIAAGSPETIVVMPDAITLYNGSMYSSSLTTGDWESFIARELVDYIDSHYRTLAARDSRGLAGHSMGGYGTLRIGMKYPQVFNSLYAMSSCCLMNRAPAEAAVAAQVARMAEGPVTGASGFTNVLQAQAAAWAPNPQNPPYYFDWPFVDGAAQEIVQAKWPANSPLVLVDQYVPALKQFAGLMLDVGDKDTLAATNAQLDAALTRIGITHGYEVYDGDHTNRVPQRFTGNVLPFFAGVLKRE